MLALAHEILPLHDDAGAVGDAVDHSGTVGFVPVKVVEDGETAMWVDGIADGSRVIVQGQDFVREGQHVEAMPTADQAASR